jgi:hypothetical protein
MLFVMMRAERSAACGGRWEVSQRSETLACGENTK